MKKNLAWQLEQLATPPDPLFVANNGYDYILIDSMYNELDRIFGANKWSWTPKNSHLDTVTDHSVFAGELSVTFADGSVKVLAGVGASQIRKRKDTAGKYIGYIDGGVSMDLPNAASKAFKNAAQQLGIRFGRSLRRDPDLGGKSAKKGSAKTLEALEAATAKEKAKEQKFKFGIAAWNKERCLEWLAKYPETSLEFAKFGHLVNARYEQIFEGEGTNGN